MMSTDAITPQRRIELVCAVSALPVLRTAVVSGADCITFELAHDRVPEDVVAQRLSETEADAGIRYAHGLGARAVVRLDTYPRGASFDHARRGIDLAAELQADAIELSDPGLMQYAARAYPALALHVGVRAGATTYEAVNFYYEHFGVKRVVVSRTVPLDQLEELSARGTAEIEVCGFGSPCIMIGGHCALSSYVTGASVNTSGICSPASAVDRQVVEDLVECRLNGALLSRSIPEGRAAPAKPCKGCYEVVGQIYQALDVTGTLNALDMVPAFRRMGVAAVRIDAARSDTHEAAWATRVWQEALKWSQPASHAGPPAGQSPVDTGEALTLGPSSPQWR